MKRLILLPFLLTALAACDRLEPASIPGGSDKNIPGVETVSVSFEQNVNDEPGTKTDVAGNGRTVWSEGDQIAYCITEADGSNPAFSTADIDLDESAVSMLVPLGHKRAHYAIYPASAAVDGYFEAPRVEYPATYDLTDRNPATWAPAPMVAANAGGQMKFYHVGGLLHLRIVGVYDDGIDEIAVVFLGAGDTPFRVTGHYSVANAATASATLTAQGEGGNTITFTHLSDIVSDATDKTGLLEFNVPVPALADYSALQKIRVDLKQSGAAARTFTYNVDGKWAKFQRARGRTAGLALHGISIAPGKQVVMARGNLQATYDGSEWNWAFAAHQTDYIGTTGANDKIDGVGTLSESGTIDLFTWNGASSTNNSLGINNSTTETDYGTVADEGLKADWGTIPDVVRKYGAGWRTLTDNEWAYMFMDRPNSTVNGVADARYTRATIMDNPATNIGTTATDAGLHGMLIFPDDFVVPTGLSANFTWGDHINSDANTASDELGRWNVFAKMTANDWALLETAGCVFLPASGFRGTAGFYYIGTCGAYWSSSPSQNYGLRTRVTIFWLDGVNPRNNALRLSACSVRLARDF